MKFAIFSYRNKKILKTFIFLFSIPAFIVLTALSEAATVTDWELLPENPVVGDMVEIRGIASPAEEINVRASFEKEVQVSDGRYEYLLEDVKIPMGSTTNLLYRQKVQMTLTSV